MIPGHVIRFPRDGSPATRADFADIPALLADPDSWFWVDIEEPDENPEVETLLGQTFALHPAAVGDLTDRNHVPKVHVYPDSVLLVLHRPEVGAQGHIHYLELDQVMSRNFLLTTHGPRNLAVPLERLLRETQSLAERILAGRVIPASPAELSYRIVSAMTKGEEAFINRLAREVGVLEKAVMAHEGDNDPQRFLEELFTVRHALLTVRTMSAQSAEIYGRTARLSSSASKDTVRFLNDLKDQYNRLERISHSQIDFLAGVTEYYRARTDTKMTIAAERLAVIAAVTLPVTALSSVIGMNVIVNPETEWWTLGILLVSMTAMSLYLLSWAKKQGWW